MTGEEFYRKRMEETNWPRNDLCDPPTDPRMAMHILIDHLLGEDWCVAMPEGDDQVITVAVTEILNKYPKNRFYAFVKKIGKLKKIKEKENKNEQRYFNDVYKR